MVYYKISEQKLRSLLHDESKLEVLESDGVDNWSWYLCGLDSYVREYVEFFDEDAEATLEDVVDVKIKKYTKINNTEN